MHNARGWTHLSLTDKILAVIFCSWWLAAMLLHVDLAADGALFRPAVVFETKSSNFPVVKEFAPGATVLLAKHDLQLGDRLLAIDGVTTRGFSQARTSIYALSNASSKGMVPIVIDRDGMQLERQLPFMIHGVPDWWPSLFGLSFGLVGLLILLRAPASLRSRPFFLGFMSFGLTWLVFPGRSEIQTTVSATSYACSMLIAAPMILRATMLLPDSAAITNRWVLNSTWIFSLMALLGTSAFFGWPLSSQSSTPALLVVINLFYLVALVILARNYFVADPLGRRQLRWVLLGFYLGFAPALLITGLVLISGASFTLYALSSIGMPLIPIGFLIAISRYNLFDIDQLISGSISYSVLIVIIAIVAETTIEPAIVFVGNEFGYDGDTVQVVFVGALAAALIPLQKLWRPLVDRLFFPHIIKVEDAVDNLIDALENPSELSPEQRLRQTVSDLQDRFHFPSASLIAQSENGLH
jgi:hypothetical protein